MSGGLDAGDLRALVREVLREALADAAPARRRAAYPATR